MAYASRFCRAEPHSPARSGGNALPHVGHVTTPSLTDLPGFQSPNRKRPTIERHELNLVGRSLAMDMDNHANIAGLKARGRNIFGQLASQVRLNFNFPLNFAAAYSAFP